MALSVILVDIGNSGVTVARWRGPAVQTAETARTRIERLIQAVTPRNAEQRYRLAEKIATTVAEDDARLVVSSVVPAVDEAVGRAVPSLLRIDHTIPFPYELELSDPAAVGSDRFCNVAAAVGNGWRDALIIDAGTATTFDLLRDGTFAGGLIAPGMAFAAHKLGEEAARLGPVTFTPVAPEVGRDTQSAMQAGAYHVGVEGVYGAAARLLECYGDRPVVLTGGLGRFLTERNWQYDPDWTLKGALVLCLPRLTL